ncbi:MAG: PASTA domain-containing protein, partial [Acidimicrobiia bacterium]
MLPIGLAVLLLALVGLGLWAAGAGGRPSGRPIEIPARADPLPSTTTAPATTTPRPSPRASGPSATLDLTTP